MKNKYAVAILAMCLTLTACGKSIDAKNADTLRVSLQSIGKNMSEAERMDFAQDIYAIYETERRESIEDVRLRNLYDTSDYEILFASSGENSELATLFGDVFADLAGTAGSALDGKSPKSLAKSADTVRSKSFAHEAQNFKLKIEGINQELSDFQQAKKDYATARDAAIAHKKVLDAKKSSVFQDVSISSMMIDGRRRVIVSGNLKITNTSDTPIRSARGRLRANVNEIPDAEYSQSITYKLDPPLAPNESVTKPIELANVLSIKGKTDRIKTLKPFVGKELSVTNPRVVLDYLQSAAKGSYQPIKFMLDHVQSNDIDQFERRSESCDAAIESQMESLAAYEKSVEYLEDSAKSVPESIEHKFPSHSLFGSRGC